MGTKVSTKIKSINNVILIMYYIFRYLKNPQMRDDEIGEYDPSPGDIRWVTVGNLSEPLGIQITVCDSGRVFVSMVNDNSTARKAGMQIGDQLLEICGINMRKATYQLASNILRQCGDSIRLLVEYNPDSMI